MTYIPPTLGNTGSILHMLASAYESRNFVVARGFIPVAKFQGDTTQVLTDGSLNVQPSNPDKTATSRLASSSNIRADNGGDNSTGKPLEVRVKRNPITGEIERYAFFNADGSIPGVSNSPWSANARYALNVGNGQIYVNNNANLHAIDWDSNGSGESVEGGSGINAVVGILEFKPLEGAALAAMQQESNELSTVIQSLSALIRSRAELERSILSTIR